MNSFFFIKKWKDSNKKAVSHLPMFE